VHLTTIAATRYVQPLREGGSLPAVVDTEAGLFVVKFRGAGQGPKALIAELIVGGIAKALGLGMPELALIEIDDLFGQSEPDPEIQDVLRASHGTNVGLRYLDGAFNFALAASGDLVEPEWAARVVWLDAFLTNPDRTHRNTNLMVWDRRVWLIDHGAALYAHHDWARVDEARARSPFPLIRDHVLLGVAGDLEATDTAAAAAVDGGIIDEILESIPDDLLRAGLLAEEFPSAEAARERYRRYLAARLQAPRTFVSEAGRAQKALLATPPLLKKARR
jgi:hypothetical protein